MKLSLEEYYANNLQVNNQSILQALHDNIRWELQKENIFYSEIDLFNNVDCIIKEVTFEQYAINVVLDFKMTETLQGHITGKNPLDSLFSSVNKKAQCSNGNITYWCYSYYTDSNRNFSINWIPMIEELDRLFKKYFSIKVTLDWDYEIVSSGQPLNNLLVTLLYVSKNIDIDYLMDKNPDFVKYFKLFCPVDSKFQLLVDKENDILLFSIE